MTRREKLSQETIKKMETIEEEIKDLEINTLQKEEVLKKAKPKKESIVKIEKEYSMEECGEIVNTILGLWNQFSSSDQRLYIIDYLYNRLNKKNE